MGWRGSRSVAVGLIFVVSGLVHACGGRAADDNGDQHSLGEAGGTAGKGNTSSNTSGTFSTGGSSTGSGNTGAQGGASGSNQGGASSSSGGTDMMPGQGGVGASAGTGATVGGASSSSGGTYAGQGGAGASPGTGGVGGSAGTGGTAGTAGSSPGEMCVGISRNMPCPVEGQECPGLSCGLADQGRRVCACTGAIWLCSSCDFSGSMIQDPPASMPNCTTQADEVACDTEWEFCQGAPGGEVCVCYRDADGALVWDCDNPPGSWP